MTAVLTEVVRQVEGVGWPLWQPTLPAIGLLILFNHSDAPKKVGFTIESGSTTWRHEFMLAAYETREISFNDLEKGRIKDDFGRLLPSTAKEGVVNWMSPESGYVTGRLMVTSRTGAMARNFSCGGVIVLCGINFATYDDYIADGETLNMYGVTDNFCTASEPLECSGGSGASGTANNNWTVGATSIIALNSSSEASKSSPLLKGISAGSGTARVNVTAGGCQDSGSGSPTVQVPTSLRLVKALPTILQQGTGLQHGCAPGWYGIEIDVEYQVLDQNGAPIASATMEPQENVPGVTDGYQDIGGPQTNYPQSAKLTRADGTFDDVPVGNCPPVPVTTLTPFSHPTQSIQILLNGTAYPVRTNNYSYSTTNLPNHGTITNGKDINATQ